MESLEAPWSGLVEVAASVDLWSVVEALGGAPAAAGADPAAWVGAGLPIRHVGLLGAPRRSGRWIHAGSRRWPRRLVGLPFGPVALEVEGAIERLDEPSVAIVGARDCTAYGLTQARLLSRAVVAGGGVVVSGLARGIDAAAHDHAGGATVAVLGQGLGVRMPSHQEQVRRRLLDAGGCVVSEFATGLQADRWTFPVRTRIIAGLAEVVVVVEAGRKSGARSTAAHGLRYGREVLAVPGPLGATASEGCLDLLEEGAGMVRGADTVLRAAGLRTGGGEAAADPALAAIGSGATIEDVMARTGWPVDEVMGAVGRLLLSGRVARTVGARYVPR